jgi:DNA-binding MarR family transcriptional regulator
MPAARSTATTEGWALTDVVTRLRRVLRSGVRTDYPWESLPMAQVEILQRLADEPGLRITDIAERHRLATNTVSNLVQQMVGAGLVSRADDASDRRVVVLRLTTDGRRQLRGWMAANSRRLESALRSLPARDRDAIARALPSLARLVDRLESAEQSSTGGATSA